jgi:acetyl esterase/lipase
MASQYTLPGRLGNPEATASNDPRTLPALKKQLDDLQAGGFIEYVVPAHDMASYRDSIAVIGASFQTFYDAVPVDLPEDKDEPDVDRSEIEVEAHDGHKIQLHVFKPRGIPADARLPGVVYFHGKRGRLFFYTASSDWHGLVSGGGMVMLETTANPHTRWAKSLSLQNMVVIMVDFRNAWTPDKHHPFPIGLNDCAAAVQWVDSHRALLNIGNFILEGESGGGNLSLAVALKANREGWVTAISGVYGYVPYISGGYHWDDEKKAKETPSQLENDGYVICTGMQVVLQGYYSPGEGELEHPLAWPYHATIEELGGLPPHVISVDELDCLRDEGIAYARKLARAGVKVTAEVNLGVTHAAALMFRQALPDVHQRHIRNIAAFARELQ